MAGTRIEISILCVPLVAGYVRPPQLGLPDVGESNISCSPAGPHLVCILHPVLSSSLCMTIGHVQVCVTIGHAQLQKEREQGPHLHSLFLRRKKATET